MNKQNMASSSNGSGCSPFKACDRGSNPLEVTKFREYGVAVAQDSTVGGFQ